MWSKTLPFQGWIRFHCMQRPHFVYPFTCQWTTGLLLPFGFCEWRYEHACTNTCSSPCFNYFGCIPRSGDLIFNFWGAAIPFSTEAAPFYISTSNVQVSQFPHILAHTYFPLFWGKGIVFNNQPSGCGVLVLLRTGIWRSYCWKSQHPQYK